MKIVDAVDPLTSDSAIVDIQRFASNSSWVEIDSTGIVDLVTFDQNSAYMRTRNGVYKTNNSGSNWSSVYPRKDIGGHFFFNKQTFFILRAFVEMIPPNPFYQEGMFDNRFLYKFGNQGQSSDILYSSRTDIYYLNFSMNSSIYFINELVGWLQMSDSYFTNIILSTSDGGATWQNANFSPDRMVFNNAQVGYYYDGSLLLKSTNAGVDWSHITFGLDGINFKNIFFSNPYTGWIVGSFYDTESSRKELLILNTTNGGGRWQHVNTDIPGEIESIHFVNNVGYISVKNNGNYALYKSTDGGQNWRVLQNSISASSLKVTCFTENLVYLYGDDIFVYSTNGGEINSLSKKSENKIGIQTIPDKYDLSQNYPNPFNPSTTLNYSLPKESSVKIEIYSVIGERVAILTDEVQLAGKYSLKWTPKNISSGIYLLRIYAEAIDDREIFAKTTKMIFLK